MARILRDGEAPDAVDAILIRAACGFACPSMAAHAMRKRLLARRSA
nr:F35 [uncultured bacterium]